MAWPIVARATLFGASELAIFRRNSCVCVVTRTLGTSVLTPPPALFTIYLRVGCVLSLHPHVLQAPSQGDTCQDIFKQEWRRGGRGYSSANSRLVSFDGVARVRGSSTMTGCWVV